MIKTREELLIRQLEIVELIEEDNFPPFELSTFERDCKESGCMDIMDDQDFIAYLRSKDIVKYTFRFDDGQTQSQYIKYQNMASAWNISYTIK